MHSSIRSALLGTFLVASSLHALADPAQDALAPLAFMVGSWQSDDGQVMDTGRRSSGRSAITSELGGAMLLRRDHTDLLDKAGKPVGGFDQLMTIYVEAGRVRADYLDGQHVIHYVSAELTPGKAVTFSSAPGAGPVFRLTYQAETADTLKVTFGMIPPGQTDFQPIAVGTLHRR